MGYSRLVICILATLLITCLRDAVFSANEYEPLPLPNNYGAPGYGMSHEWGFNDIVFLETYPEPESLSDAEKYMISGATSNATGSYLSPWHRTILDLANLCYEEWGEVPIQLSSDKIAELFTDVTGGENIIIDDQQISKYTNPITGEFPKLVEPCFSPGNMYIRVLTGQERERIADHDYGLWLILHEGLCWEFGGASKLVPAALKSEVFYFRVYGENQTILAGIWYCY